MILYLPPKATPGFGLLVFTPHIFHFALVLALSFWHPELGVRPSGAFKYLAPLLDMGEVLIRLFLLVHQALFSLVNLGFGVASDTAAYAGQLAKAQELTRQAVDSARRIRC